MELISQKKDNNFSTWEALKEDYLNEEKKNHRAATVRDIRLRLDRFLDCFKQKRNPRDSETLFNRFYDFHLINLSSGVQGRRRNVGDIRVFLIWAVEDKGAPYRWFPINTKAANKYIVIVPKGQKKKGKPRVLSRYLELLLESLKHAIEPCIRTIFFLSAVYGIRVSEIAHMEIKDGVVQLTRLKQNAKNFEIEEVSTRIVEPLNLPNLQNEGQRIVSLLKSKKLKFPPDINRAIEKAKKGQADLEEVEKIQEEPELFKQELNNRSEFLQDYLGDQNIFFKVFVEHDLLPRNAKIEGKDPYEIFGIIDKTKKSGFVYFFRNADIYKIGIIDNLIRRMKELEADEIINTIKCNNYDSLEKDLHKELKFKKKEHESF